MKRIFLILTILLVAVASRAQDADSTLVAPDRVEPQNDSVALPPVPAWDMETTFAVRDTCTLSMDIYFPKDDKETHPCVLFVYGGGFIQNNQKEASVRRYCRRLADAGFVAVATDYRLGLKGVKNSSLMTMADNLDRAIQLSTEDLFSAVEYLITYADELCIDPSQIILAGSSAGAITVLQADYELGNRTQLAAAMPADFRFAGVISFSGAIFSRKGKCKWTVQPPAPTLFLHGTSDELVTYNKIQVFNLGFFGTNQLVERFEKFDYPYMCIRFENRYHEVAAFMNGFFNQTVGFIEQFVFNKKNWQVDVTFTDPDFDLAKPWAFTPKDLYK